KAAGSDLARGCRAENTGNLLGSAAKAHRTTGKVFWSIGAVKMTMGEKLISASQSGWVWRKRTWGYGSKGVSSAGSLADQSVKLLASQDSAKRRDNMRAYCNDRESDQLAT
ncbi:MAG: hypothetical protein ACXW6T_07465, partial [Candidatus Binatia bacterium]